MICIYIYIVCVCVDCVDVFSCFLRLRPAPSRRSSPPSWPRPTFGTLPRYGLAETNNVNRIHHLRQHVVHSAIEF